MRTGTTARSRATRTGPDSEKNFSVQECFLKVFFATKAPFHDQESFCPHCWSGIFSLDSIWTSVANCHRTSASLRISTPHHLGPRRGPPHLITARSDLHPLKCSRQCQARLACAERFCALPTGCKWTNIICGIYT